MQPFERSSRGFWSERCRGRECLSRAAESSAGPSRSAPQLHSRVSESRESICPVWCDGARRHQPSLPSRSRTESNRPARRESAASRPRQGSLRVAAAVWLASDLHSSPMPRILPRLVLLSFFVLTGFDTACGQVPVNSVQNLTPPPPIRREFRGVWVASVENIDWPSVPGLSTREQQEELLAILDRAVALKLNAVILQVRPAADALYASPYEPWSEYLTGKMGRPPNPWYDPLEFAVNEAHKRGLELHAWFNPYRAHHPSGRSRPSPNHISVTHPELVKRYGSMLWMDPGEPEVREHTVRVVLDVVQRYDIDGVHIDDYFYPYKEKDRRGRLIEFPDATSWRKYLRSGGGLSRDDW